MTDQQNIAAWLPAVGAKLEVRPASTPEPGHGELLIQTKAVAIQPAEYKIQDGVLPFPLTYPTIIGCSLSLDSDYPAQTQRGLLLTRQAS
jgi:NADPH:quinone reductase-like Zn-dependent oxidoreductase